MFDPFDPAQSRDAWELLARMRAESEVVTIANGMRYVTRYEESRGVLRDPTRFSNASGMKAPGVEVPFEDRLLGELDPPRHTAVRRVMVTALTPKAVHAAEPFIHDTARALLGPERDHFDLVATYTVMLPNRVTVHLLGFDPADADQLARWAKELMESSFPAYNRTDRGDGFAGAFPEFAGYIDDRIAQRAAELDAGAPVDDVLGRLITLDVEDGQRLPHRQLRALVRNLVTGGLTTTSQLLGNLLYVILSDAELEAQVRSDSACLATAIEESLRLMPPLLFLARGCATDTQIGSCPVHRGERVIVGAASANRDERMFADADRFDVERPNADQHLTFGYGPHVCPGATLARVVARIGIEAVFARFEPGSLRLEPGFVFEQVPTYFEHGPRRLPVVVG